jgi:hypothetical protein
MATITFASADALETFHTVCEGMSEVARDDDASPTADLLDRIITDTGTAIRNDATYPVTVPLNADLVEEAERVIENAIDTDDIESGMVVVTR